MLALHRYFTTVEGGGTATFDANIFLNRRFLGSQRFTGTKHKNNDNNNFKHHISMKQVQEAMNEKDLDEAMVSMMEVKTEEGGAMKEEGASSSSSAGTASERYEEEEEAPTRKLVVQKLGMEGRMYLDVKMTCVRTAPSFPARDRGFKITRNYSVHKALEAANMTVTRELVSSSGTRKDHPQQLETVLTIVPRTLVLVTLEIEVDSPRRHVAVVDYLPSGLEAKTTIKVPWMVDFVGRKSDGMRFFVTTMLPVSVPAERRKE